MPLKTKSEVEGWGMLLFVGCGMLLTGAAAGAVGWLPTGVPQIGQNFVLCSSSMPQELQCFGRLSSDFWPQAGQNFAPCGISVLHLLQNIVNFLS